MAPSRPINSAQASITPVGVAPGDFNLTQAPFPCSFRFILTTEQTPQKANDSNLAKGTLFISFPRNLEHRLRAEPRTSVRIGNPAPARLHEDKYLHSPADPHFDFLCRSTAPRHWAGARAIAGWQRPPA